MENVRFEVYREGEPEKVVRLALVDRIDHINLVTKNIDDNTEYTLLNLNKATGTFCLIGHVGADAGLPLDGSGRVIIEGFNARAVWEEQP